MGVDRSVLLEVCVRARDRGGCPGVGLERACDARGRRAAVLELFVHHHIPRARNRVFLRADDEEMGLGSNLRARCGPSVAVSRKVAVLDAPVASVTVSETVRSPAVRDVLVGAGTLASTPSSKVHL
jgi:hypothetical protein